MFQRFWNVWLLSIHYSKVFSWTFFISIKLGQLVTGWILLLFKIKHGKLQIRQNCFVWVKIKIHCAHTFVLKFKK